MKIIMVGLLQRKNFLSLLTPRKPLRIHLGKDFPLRGNSFYNRQKFLLASLVLSDLIHLRKNYSSIDALLCDGLDLWSCKLKKKKATKRSLPCSPHHLNCTPFQAPVLSTQRLSRMITKQYGGLWWSEKRSYQGRFSSHLLGNEGIWTVSLSRGQDLHPKCSWYRIQYWTTSAWRGPFCLYGLLSPCIIDSMNVQSLKCHSGDLILRSIEYAIWKIMRSQECLSWSLFSKIRFIWISALLMHQYTNSRPEGRIETSNRDPGKTLLKSRFSNSRLFTLSSNGFPDPGHDQREAEEPCVGILQRDGNEASYSVMVAWTLSPWTFNALEHFIIN